MVHWNSFHYCRENQGRAMMRLLPARLDGMTRIRAHLTLRSTPCAPPRTSGQPRVTSSLYRPLLRQYGAVGRMRAAVERVEIGHTTTVILLRVEWIVRMHGRATSGGICMNRCAAGITPLLAILTRALTRALTLSTAMLLRKGLHLTTQGRRAEDRLAIRLRTHRNCKIHCVFARKVWM